MYSKYVTSCHAFKGSILTLPMFTLLKLLSSESSTKLNLSTQASKSLHLNSMPPRGMQKSLQVPHQLGAPTLNLSQ